MNDSCFFTIGQHILLITKKHWTHFLALNKKNKLDLWLTIPKGATPVNKTSVTNWQMVVRRDNVILASILEILLSKVALNGVN